MSNQPPPTIELTRLKNLSIRAVCDKKEELQAMGPKSTSQETDNRPLGDTHPRKK